MADRRFLSKSVLCQDKFLDMKNSSQVLYFYLVLYADDDGFVDCVKTVKRLSKARQMSLKELWENGFIHVFYDDLLVITHWRTMNKIPPSKYEETQYKAEKALLSVDSKGVYHIKKSDIAPTQQAEKKLPRIGKDRLGEGNILLRANGCENAPASQSRKPKQAAVYTAEFEEVWALYPKKMNKYKAYRAYQKAVDSGASVDDIKAGINRYRDYIAREKIKKQYIKHGSTFFNQRSWEDDYDIDIKPKRPQFDDGLIDLL